MANKGNYYKLRTKKWLEKEGYQVAYLERVLWIHGQGRMIPIKKDQFGADLLAVDSKTIAFVQVKLGKKNVASARTEFGKYTFPPFSEQWILIWEPRWRKPEIIIVK